MAAAGFIENDDIHDMCTLDSESTTIFHLRFNDLTVLFHIGFWDTLSNYIWIKFCMNIAFTKSESKKANFYQVVQGMRTCTKVLTPDKFGVKNKPHQDSI